MPLVLVTRPKPAAAQTAARIAGRTGWPVIVSPLAFVTSIAAPPPEHPYAGVLLTSANAAPALGPYTSLPIYTVGHATAEAARTMGCHSVTSAAGDGLALANLVGQKVPTSHLLYLSGEQVQHDMAALLPNHTITRHIVYRTAPITTLHPEAEKAEVVIFHSRTTLRTYMELTAHRPAAFCLSPAIAAIAGVNWPHIKSAPEPTEEALLETLYSAYLTR